MSIHFDQVILNATWDIEVAKWLRYRFWIFFNVLAHQINIIQDIFLIYGHIWLPLPKVHVWPSLVSRLAVRATQGISIFLACQAKDLKKIESIRVLYRWIGYQARAMRKYHNLANAMRKTYVRRIPGIYLPGDCHTKVLQARRIPGESHINILWARRIPGEYMPGEYQATFCQATPIRNTTKIKPGEYQATLPGEPHTKLYKPGECLPVHYHTK